MGRSGRQTFGFKIFIHPYLFYRIKTKKVADFVDAPQCTDVAVDDVAEAGGHLKVALHVALEGYFQ